MNEQQNPLRDPRPGEKLDSASFESIVRLAPLVSIDIVVRSADGRVLVGRRRNQPAKGSFFVPGGRITKNETAAVAFKRITREELGVEKELQEARFLGTFDHIYEENVFEKDGFRTHYVVLAYDLTLPDATLVPPQDQHTEYVWKTEDQLLDWSAVHEFTKAYFRGGFIRSEVQYSALANRKNSFTTMMWQTPALSLTAQAFLINAAGNPAAYFEIRIAA